MTNKEEIMKKLLKDVFIDQYGNRFYADTVEELRSQIKNGGSTVHKMYQDKGGKAFISVIL